MYHDARFRECKVLYMIMELFFSFDPPVTFPFPRFACGKERTYNHEVLVLYVSTSVEYNRRAADTHS